MLIGVIYRSPSSNSENDAKSITTISSIEDYHDCTGLLLMGNFNTVNVTGRILHAQIAEAHLHTILLMLHWTAI